MLTKAVFTSTINQKLILKHLEIRHLTHIFANRKSHFKFAKSYTIKPIDDEPTYAKHANRNDETDTQQ